MSENSQGYWRVETLSGVRNVQGSVGFDTSYFTTDMLEVNIDPTNVLVFSEEHWLALIGMPSEDQANFPTDPDGETWLAWKIGRRGGGTDFIVAQAYAVMDGVIALTYDHAGETHISAVYMPDAWRTVETMPLNDIPAGVRFPSHNLR